MKQYLIFIFGGGIGIVLAVLTTTVLTEVFKLWYGLSYGFGLIVSTIFKFLYHRSITFNRLSWWKTRFARFIFLTVLMVIANWLLVYASSEALANIFHEEVKAPYYITAIFLVGALLSIVNFGFNKRWVFRN